MNMFKGLMFLQGHFSDSEALEETRTQYGARTAAADFGRSLGNRAASAAWFARGSRSAETASEPATPAPKRASAVRDRRRSERRTNDNAAQPCHC